MVDRKQELAEQARNAITTFRADIDMPREDANVLLMQVVLAENEMLKLLQAEGKTRFEHNNCVFVVQTEESTDSGRSGTVDDWTTRRIRPRCKFVYES